MRLSYVKKLLNMRAKSTFLNKKIFFKILNVNLRVCCNDFISKKMFYEEIAQSYIKT